jgi:hypothetical protein
MTLSIAVYGTGFNIHGRNHHHEKEADYDSSLGYKKTHTLESIINILEHWPTDKKKPNFILRTGRETKAKWYLKIIPKNKIESNKSYNSSSKNFTVWTIQWHDEKDEIIDLLKQRLKTANDNLVLLENKNERLLERIRYLEKNQITNIKPVETANLLDIEYNPFDNLT